VSAPSDGTGTFAEESARLLAAFQEWVAKGHMAVKDLAGQRDSGAAATGGVGSGSTCGVCPICQGIALLRGARPEVVEHLSDAMTSLVAAMTAMVPTDAEPPARRRQERVQHIDVSGDDLADTTG
jgi:hypothetical protein